MPLDDYTDDQLKYELQRRFYQRDGVRVVLSTAGAAAHFYVERNKNTLTFSAGAYVFVVSGERLLHLSMMAAVASSGVAPYTRMTEFRVNSTSLLGWCSYLSSRGLCSSDFVSTDGVLLNIHAMYWLAMFAQSRKIALSDLLEDDM